MADTPESKVKRKVKALLNEHRAYHYWPVPVGYGTATLDCLGFHCGYGFAIETKAPDGRLTVRQKATILELSEARCKVFVIKDDKGVEELREWLICTALLSAAKS